MSEEENEEIEEETEESSPEAKSVIPVVETEDKDGSRFEYQTLYMEESKVTSRTAEMYGEKWEPIFQNVIADSGVLKIVMTFRRPNKKASSKTGGRVGFQHLTSGSKSESLAARNS
jgi:hypothetical protein